MVKPSMYLNTRTNAISIIEAYSERHLIFRVYLESRTTLRLCAVQVKYFPYLERCTVQV